MPDSEELNTGFLSTAAPVPGSGSVPQFSTAEYAHIPGTERCRVCGNLVSGDYYRINGQMACSLCAQQAAQGQPADSHIAFGRGLLFGIGAAILAMAGYAIFTIVTHLYLGYLALGVGWLIAKAITKGSNGLGGIRYQITAVILTYFSIATAEIPILLAQIVRSPRFHGDLGTVILHNWPRLLWFGVASPFLDLMAGLHGIIGLFILSIGLRIAWRLTAARPLAVDGPYPVGA
jgi:hypothetical protein